MTQFEDMTIEEQKAWWLEEAKSALQQFNMSDTQLKWLSYTHNAVFDVSQDNERYVLRLQSAENGTWLHGELAVLRALQEAGIGAPQPVQSYETDKVCGALFRYVDGAATPAETVTLEAMQQIGAYLAQLHDLSIRESNRPRLDYDGLFSKSGIYYPGDENMTVFNEQQLAVIDALAQKVKVVMNELGQGDAEFGLIHGDFLLKNILFHEGDIRALDFEYCGWGYYLYDLTPILWQLKPQARYQSLEDSLWEGYTAVRLLTRRHRDLLETLIAARQVASMRWIAANQQNPYVVGKVEIILAQRTAELQDFLDTGKLRRT